jgi:exodeoxyribonuclease-5
VIACGDPGQLLPVNQPVYFKHPDAELKEIHRQALDSPIIRQAHRVRQGLPYQPDGDAFQVKREATVEDVIEADILLCWRKDQERQRLNHRARSYREIWPAVPQVGEPVMCRKNVRGAGIYNGAIYPLLEPFLEGSDSIVIDVDTDRVRLQPVFFEGVQSNLKPGVELQTWFTYGYACTVHKAAGSEWNRVIVWDTYRREERDRWLYTAITRAAQQLIIVSG